jgi:HAD superfamily hydrolase (TIGR01490 family)
MSSRKAAFFDLDGTLTSVRTWAGILDYFKHRGEKRFTYFQFWAYHTILYFLHKAKLLSQTGFREPWAANLGWFLRGLAEDEVEDIWRWMYEHHFTGHWHAHSLEILDRHKQQGDYLVLVSASPAPLGRFVAKQLGMDLAVGTEFEVIDGCYTGRVQDKVCIADRKATQTKMRLLDASVSINFADSSAYADSPGDLAMLEMTGRPVALNPDNLLLPIAKDRGWEIVLK